MIRIELEMDKPKECHDCPFQLKFKNDEAGDWYTRRCVILHQIIEYPLPDWCPIKEIQEDKNGILYHHYCIKCGWDWWSTEAFPNRCSKCDCELT